LASANGPITAIVPDFFKGNCFSFYNTKDCDAISLASKRFELVKISFFALLHHHNIYTDLE
jgi:hypothetical protein